MCADIINIYQKTNRNLEITTNKQNKYYESYYKNKKQL